MEPQHDNSEERDLPAAGLGEEDLFGAGMSAHLDGFVAGARAEHAAARRRRERWLQHQALEEGTLRGVLVGLTEREATVAVHAGSGRVHHGVVDMVGRDFVVLARRALPDVVLPLASVAAVTAGAGSPVTAGDREPDPARTFAQLLEGLCSRRERVTLVAGDGRCTVTGRLWSVGRDVLTVRVDSGGLGDRGTAYLPLDGIGELVLA